MNKRISSYDFLRITCMIGVIFIHVSAHYLSHYANVNQNNLYNINQYYIIITSIYNSIGRFGVPIFLMLTGALLLKNPQNRNYKYFYKKSFKKVFMPVIVFSVCYTIYNIIIMFMGTNKNILRLIKNILIGKPFYHMWYMYMLIGVYLFIPFLIRLKDKVGEKNFKKIAIIYFPISILSLWTSKFFIEWDISRSFLYLGYVMIGYIISNEKQKHNAFIFLGIGIILELIAAFIVYKVTAQGILLGNLKFSIHEPGSPIIMLASLCIFIAFTNFKLKGNYEKISNLSYYIYLFHAGILNFIINFINTLKGKNFLLQYNPFIIIPIIASVVFIISYLCASIYKKIEESKKIQELNCKICSKIVLLNNKFFQRKDEKGVDKL